MKLKSTGDGSSLLTKKESAGPMPPGGHKDKKQPIVVKKEDALYHFFAHRFIGSNALKSIRVQDISNRKKRRAF